MLSCGGRLKSFIALKLMNIGTIPAAVTGMNFKAVLKKIKIFVLPANFNERKIYHEQFIPLMFLRPEIGYCVCLAN